MHVNFFKALAGMLLAAPLTQVLADTELTGSLAIEQRWFLEDSPYDGVSNEQMSLYIEPEWYWESDEGLDSLIFKPYLRVDEQDSERTHADIRELMWLHVGDEWELRAGIGKVFWGQTESQHLVDVINQSDFVEAIDGEDKLGQPMVNVQWIKDWGTASVFVLPYFRERTFPGVEGRFRLPFEVAVDDALYESDRGQHHLDWAARWSHTLGDWEVGLSYFDGTSREPLLLPELQKQELVLVPYYEQMQQFGVDTLAVVDSWLLKFEGIHRRSRSDNFTAITTGFEYTQVGVLDSVIDLGYLMEYQYDERGSEATSIGQNDLMLGARLVFNDINGTELLAGFVQDLDDNNSQSAFVEAFSRINDHWKWRLDGWFFTSNNTSDTLYLIRRDDYVQLSLEYYF